MVKLCFHCGRGVRGKLLHDVCLRAIQARNDQFLLQELPYLLPEKEANYATGLAFECDTCYRVTIPHEIWILLPLDYRTTTGSYLRSARRITTCLTCVTQGPPSEYQSNPWF